MEKNKFIFIMNEKLKLVRTEYGLTQEKMAEILGISKKSLIEVEKKRRSLGWTGAVALASIFSDSTVLSDTLGGNTNDIIIAVAFRQHEVDYPKTWGGKVWWQTVVNKDGYQIQRNIVSRHYRLLDIEDRRLFTSFSYQDTESLMEHIISDLSEGN